ncbi:MAG: hypothetical protein ACRCTE_10940 [Cellulosilyticaceae bacterium]
MGFLDSIKKIILDQPMASRDVKEVEQEIKEVEEELEEIEEIEEAVDLVEAISVEADEKRPHKINKEDLFRVIWEDVTKCGGE